MGEIEQIESGTRNDRLFEESLFNVLMNIKISDLIVDFNCQIPCSFCQDPSVCGEISKLMKK